MNDFTKEELEDITAVYRSFCGDGRLLTDLEQSILKKLNTIVASSNKPCEHEFTRKKLQIDLCDKCKTFKFVFAEYKKDAIGISEKIQEWIKRLKWITLCKKCGMNPDICELEK